MSKVWPELQPRVNISRGICLQKSYKERTTRQVFLSETFQKAIFECSRNGEDVPNLSSNLLAIIVEKMLLNKIYLLLMQNKIFPNKRQINENQ